MANPNTPNFDPSIPAAYFYENNVRPAPAAMPGSGSDIGDIAVNYPASILGEVVGVSKVLTPEELAMAAIRRGRFIRQPPNQ